MTSLDWQEAPQKNGSHNAHSSTPQAPKGALGFIIGIMSGAAFSMALMGLIVGYALGKWVNPSAFGSNAAQVVAQAPSAPTPAAPTPQVPAPSGPLAPIDPKVDHIRGDITKAQVAVVEYSDFECPFCKRVEPTMTQISKDYGDKVVVVYRHFPLSFHANAQKEAEASECANDLGGNDAFWKYHDAILERTTSNGAGFPLDNLVPLAKEIGLNEAKFKSCLDSGQFAKHVQDEETSGQAAGVNGTPGNFIVNLKTQKNQAISGAVPFATFKSAIDTMLQS